MNSADYFLLKKSAGGSFQPADGLYRFTETFPSLYGAGAVLTEGGGIVYTGRCPVARATGIKLSIAEKQFPILMARALSNR